MEAEPIITKKLGRIGVITLNRPEARNTFTIPFAEQLDQALSTMDQDPEVLVVVINANGKRYGESVPGFGPIQGDHADSAQFFCDDRFRLHGALL